MKTLKGSFSALVLTGSMLMFAAPAVHADDDHRECREHIAKAQHNLDRAIAKHGEQSPQAERARHELNEQREGCWNREKGYWGADNRWHDQRDWDQDHH